MAGKELWLPNASSRSNTGITRTDWSPGQLGEYWSSTQSGTSTAYYLQFYSTQSAGNVYGDKDKLRGYSVRCVR